MIKAYPAIIHNDEDGIWVSFPDLEGCQSTGANLEETLSMAEEALGLYLAALLDGGQVLPVATLLENVKVKAPDLKTYITVETDRYHRDMKAVKKTVSIPSWQAKAAEQRNLSLSKILQQALNNVLSVPF